MISYPPTILPTIISQNDSRNAPAAIATEKTATTSFNAPTQIAPSGAVNLSKKFAKTATLSRLHQNSSTFSSTA